MAFQVALRVRKKVYNIGSSRRISLAGILTTLTTVAFMKFEAVEAVKPHGNAMLLFGGGVAGGTVHGTWPGLAPANLDDGDLRGTTDYRDVLAEVLTERCRQSVAGPSSGGARTPSDRSRCCGPVASSQDSPA